MEEIKNKTKVDELDELIEKISVAMDMTKDKQNNIDKMTDELYNETRPMMVEKMKKEIEEVQNNKTEFDEMTENALINAKKSILEIMEESEKAYQDKLLETLKRKQDIDRKLSSIRKGEYPEEKIIAAETYANKAMEKVNAEMEEFKKSHFKLIKKLSEYEKTIYDNAVELGVEQKIDAVTLEKEKPEPKPEKTKTKKVEPAKTEPKPVKTVKTEPEKTEPIKTKPKPVEPVKTVKPEPKPEKTKTKKVEPAKTEPKPVESEQEKNQGKKLNPRDYKWVYPINQETVRAWIDVTEGIAKLDIKVTEDANIGVTLDLEKLMDSKNQRKIRKEAENRFKESGEKNVARMIRKLNRKINPVLLALAVEGDNGLDILRKYIDAVKMGDKELLPFKYNVNLDGERDISDKAFAKLNGYIDKDNKNLGTNFNIIKGHPVKNFLNKILPDKMRLEDRKMKLLSAPEKIKDIGNQTKEKAVGLGKNVAEEIQVAGIKMAGYMNGENQHLTDMKVRDARKNFVPKAKVDEKLAVEKCTQKEDGEKEETIDKSGEIKE